MSIRSRIILFFSMIGIIGILWSAGLLRQIWVLRDDLDLVRLQDVISGIHVEAGNLKDFMEYSANQAVALSSLGTELYERRQRLANKEQAENDISAALARALERQGEQSGIYGFCMAFEPGVILPGVELFDPYANWDKGAVTTSPSDEESFFDREWYASALPKGWNKKQKREQKFFWSAPYISVDDGNVLMTSVSAPIYSAGNEIVGVALADVSLSTMNSRTKALLGDIDGISFVIHDKSSMLVAFPTRTDMLLKPISALPFGHDIVRLMGEYTRKKPGERTITSVEGQWELVLTPIGGGMTAGVMLPHSYLYGESNKEKRNLLIASIVAFILVCSAVAATFYLILSRVVAPVGNLAAYAKTVATGNYVTKPKGVYMAELAVLRDAFADMIKEIQRRIGEADMQSQEAMRRAAEAETLQAEVQVKAAEEAKRLESMLAAAGQLAEVSGEVLSVTEDVRQQSRSIGQGAKTQLAHSQSTMDAVRQMDNSIIQVARNAEETAQNTSGASAMAGEGDVKLQRAVKAMEGLQAMMRGLNDEMHSLDVQARSIGDIMDIIAEIADQTNLLALNAAIEAARAGESGRGFAVVADEVRKLAEKTMQATGEVGTSIRNIQNTSNSSIEAMDKAMQEVNSVGKLSAEAGEALQRAVRSSENAATQVKQIAAATNEQTAAAEELAKHIDEFNKISSDAVDRTEKTASTLDRLAQQTQVLSSIVDKLQTR